MVFWDNVYQAGCHPFMAINQPGPGCSAKSPNLHFFSDTPGPGWIAHRRIYENQKKHGKIFHMEKDGKILEKYGKIDYLVAHHSKSLSSVASSKWTKPTYPNEITRNITYLVSEMSHQVTKIMGESWENMENPWNQWRFIAGKSINVEFSIAMFDCQIWLQHSTTHKTEGITRSPQFEWKKHGDVEVENAEICWK